MHPQVLPCVLRFRIFGKRQHRFSGSLHPYRASLLYRLTVACARAWEWEARADDLGVFFDWCKEKRKHLGVDKLPVIADTLVRIQMMAAEAQPSEGDSGTTGE